MGWGAAASVHQLECISGALSNSGGAAVGVYKQSQKRPDMTEEGPTLNLQH